MSKFTCLFIIVSLLAIGCKKKDNPAPPNRLLGRWYLATYNAPGQPAHVGDSTIYNMVETTDTSDTYVFYEDRTVIQKFDSAAIHLLTDGIWELKPDSTLKITTARGISNLQLGFHGPLIMQLTDLETAENVSGHIRIYQKNLKR